MVITRNTLTIRLSRVHVRNKLSVATMNALLQVQCSHNEPSYAFKPSAQKMLTRCKNTVEAIQ